MPNLNLFASSRGQQLPPADTLNAENAPAYALTPKQSLAQFAATGCFSQTFYVTAEDQLKRVLELCDQVEPAFVAKLAVYSRERAYMKDMPALLCAWLSAWGPELHDAVFERVIDSTRMLRTYVQIMRSGVVGRKSLGTAPKRAVRQWLARQSEEALFRGSVGQSPSLPDVLKMVHPKPATKQREAFYAYLLGKPYDAGQLPELVRQYEAFKSGASREVPDLPFTMLSSLELTTPQWAELARNASWQTTRMNLNTFARHGVFAQGGLRGTLASLSLATEIAARMRNPEAIAKARVFPYQLMVAYQNVAEAVPQRIKLALQDAMEIAVASLPKLEGRVAVFPDVSGSMASPVTGFRAGSSSAVRCIDVAALVAAAVLRKNPDSVVVPFEQDVVSLDLNGRDSIMTNAAKLASIGGGGTNCGAPLQWLNRQREKADLVIYVSDNESWVDPGCGRGTALMAEWVEFKKWNPLARLVCLDIQPNQTTQAQERADILNIGGFSDQVFEVIRAFASRELEAGHWVARIENVA